MGAIYVLIGFILGSVFTNISIVFMKKPDEKQIQVGGNNCEQVQIREPEHICKADISLDAKVMKEIYESVKDK